MKKNEIFLLHILDAISDINIFTEGITQDEFYNNKEKQYAIIRALEIVGEAVKNLDRDFKSKYKIIPWKEISGMRDKLIHGYFGIKIELVWETVKYKIPKLKEQINKILELISK